MRVKINSLKETKKYAKMFFKTLVGGEIICLDGDLGAGKTTFTKFLAHFMGIRTSVTSPTFTLIQEYKGKKFNLVHADMYRIEDESELIEMGFEDILYNHGKDKIIIIEWPEKIPHILKNLKVINIKVEKGEGDSRYFTTE